ncbi:MAG: enoyl-CoA hydratase/isomerase family protein [Betaproteobacteria bacterium]|nr:enoyl-CoA hydratase/isomerase family protein [Betaproteobacteria bacterium]
MAEDLILFDEFDNYAVITFNRPEKLNALSTPMVQQFQQRLDDCKGRHAVVVITARGKAFCAGVDLRERNDWVRKGAKVRGDNVRNKWYDTMGTIIRNHPAIFIAAVNGLALGGGATLVNICDLAIMAEDAEIGVPQINWGIYPGIAGASTQMRVLRKHSAWPILTARSLSAADAVEIGMVNLAVPAEKLLDEARALAAHIAQFDPIALDWCKKALDQIPSHFADWSVALEYGRSVNNIIQDQVAKAKGLSIGA